MSNLPTRVPELTAASEPFWHGAAEGRLMLLRCDSCRVIIWYPRPFCPDCGGRSTSWEEATGEGTVYSFTITRKGQGQWRDAGPYVLAYVELDEGPRVLTNIVGADPADVHIGQAVVADFSSTPRDDGEAIAVPRFRPA